MLKIYSFFLLNIKKNLYKFPKNSKICSFFSFYFFIFEWQPCTCHISVPFQVTSSSTTKVFSQPQRTIHFQVPMATTIITFAPTSLQFLTTRPSFPQAKQPLSVNHFSTCSNLPHLKHFTQPNFSAWWPPLLFCHTYT